MNGAVVRGDRVDRIPTVQKLGRAVLLQGQAVVDTHLVFELGIQRRGGARGVYGVRGVA